MRVTSRPDLRSNQSQPDPSDRGAPELLLNDTVDDWSAGFQAPASQRRPRPGWRDDCGNETQGDETLSQLLGAQLLDAQGMPNLVLLATVTPTEVNVALHLHASAMQRRNLCRHDCACAAADVEALEQEIAQILVELNCAKAAGTEAPLVAMMTRQHTLVDAQLQRARGLQAEEQDYLTAAQLEVETGQARLVEWLKQVPSGTVAAEMPIGPAQAQRLGGHAALLVPGAVVATAGVALAVINILTLMQWGEADSPSGSAASLDDSILRSFVVATLAAAGLAAILNATTQR